MPCCIYVWMVHHNCQTFTLAPKCERKLNQNARVKMKLIFWNMCLQKTTIIAAVMLPQIIDLATFSETYFKEAGQIEKSSQNILSWKCKITVQHTDPGVTFMVRLYLCLDQKSLSLVQIKIYDLCLSAGRRRYDAIFLIVCFVFFLFFFPVFIVFHTHYRFYSGKKIFL